MTIAVRIYPHYRKALLPHALVCAVMTQMMPLSDDDRNECLRMAQGPYVQAYPIDTSKVARAQPGGDGDARGRDPRAPHARLSACPACRRNLTRDDWEHSREIGQCAYFTRNLGYQTALAVRTESHDTVQYTPISRAMDADGLLPLIVQARHANAVVTRGHMSRNLR